MLKKEIISSLIERETRKDRQREREREREKEEPSHSKGVLKMMGLRHSLGPYSPTILCLLH